VLGGTWLAIQHPLLFLIALLLFVMAAALLIRLVLRGLRRLFGTKPA